MSRLFSDSAVNQETLRDSDRDRTMIMTPGRAPGPWGRSRTRSGDRASSSVLVRRRLATSTESCDFATFRRACVEHELSELSSSTSPRRRPALVRRRRRQATDVRLRAEVDRDRRRAARAQTPPTALTSCALKQAHGGGARGSKRRRGVRAQWLGTEAFGECGGATSGGSSLSVQ